MKNAVIVLSWGKGEMTRKCLHSIRDNSSLDHDIFWVQNECKVDRGINRQTEQQLASIYVIANEVNLGFAKGVNLGVNAAMLGDYTHITLINNDVVVFPDWDSRMHMQLSVSAEKDVGGMSVLTDNGGFQRVNVAANKWDDVRPWKTGSIEAYDQELRETRDPSEPRYVIDHRAAAFFCVMFPKRTWELVGMLDESFGLAYAEDSDYCRRMRKEGMMMGITTCVAVHHKHGGSTDKQTNARLRKEAVDKYVEKWGSL